MNTKKITVNSLLLAYIAINPLFDMIYTLTYTILGIELPININQLVRVLGLMLIFIYIGTIKNLFKCIALVVWIVLSYIVNIKNGIVYNLTIDIGWSLKIFSALIFYLAFREIFSKKLIPLDDILKAFTIAGYLSITSILLAYFGIGLNTYSAERSGVKGLFSTNNSIAIYLLMIFPMYYLVYKGFQRLFSIFICLIALLSIGAKAAIAGGLLSLCVIIIYENTISNDAEKKFSFYRNKLFNLLIIIFAGVPCLIYIGYGYIIDWLNIINNTSYFTSIESFITSNRNVAIEILGFYLYNDQYYINPLFGAGYSRVQFVLNRISAFNTVEQDFHGMYYLFGGVIFIIFTFIVIRVVVRIFILNRSLQLRQRNIFIISFIVIIGIIHAYFAGHVFYEAISQLPFWCLVGYLDSYYKSSVPSRIYKFKF